MGYIANLTSLEGRKGIYTIFLTATLLTVFEIVFFYKIVSPNVEQQMNKGLEMVSRLVAGRLRTMKEGYREEKNSLVANQVLALLSKSVFSQQINGMVQTMHERDQLLVEGINQYTMFTGGLIIASLSMALVFLWMSVKRSGEANTSMKVPTQTALFTVGFLIAFQITFYFFGRRYRYPGTLGEEEFMSVILNAVRTAPITEETPMSQDVQAAATSLLASPIQDNAPSDVVISIN